MAETTDAENPLVSKSSSDPSLSVQLHPLVLLTISDYITRHTLREHQGPIVGAIIGQQNGREVSMEHAFECKLSAAASTSDHASTLALDEEWFAERLEQYKEVHKAPALDLVAIFALGPATGPQPQHIPILQQLQTRYNDSLILLLFHPDTILDGSLTGSKLPLSLYESFYEPGADGADSSLQARQLQMRFRQLPYDVETAEAEMIAVDFVAKGSGTATATVPAPASVPTTQKSGGEGSRSAKGKAKPADIPTIASGSETALDASDQDLIASLTGKANAIKMLHQRINLIKTYLQSLPDSYLTDASLAPSADQSTQLNQPLLRNISSLLSRLPLLAPPPSHPSTETTTTPSSQPPSLATASAHEHADVQLVSLLSALTRSLAEAKDMGSKYAIVQKARSDKMPSLSRGSNRGPFGGGGGGGAGAPGFGGILEDSPNHAWGSAGDMVPEY
ncbi:hypothetical protein AAFC00_004073 [Neodothiora populina]|uniref:COP9 signalosome complex subunit 6 n=1 Tax=Neodothiora populina TaxID=2781224 RepID=A0ABR3PJH9_9PEZI